MLIGNTNMGDPFANGSASEIHRERQFIEKMLDGFQADEQLKHFIKQSEQYLMETEHMVNTEK